MCLFYFIPRHHTWLIFLWLLDNTIARWNNSHTIWSKMGFWYRNSHNISANYVNATCCATKCSFICGSQNCGRTGWGKWALFWSVIMNQWHPNGLWKFAFQQQHNTNYSSYSNLIIILHWSLKKCKYYLFASICSYKLFFSIEREWRFQQCMLCCHDGHRSTREVKWQRLLIQVIWVALHNLLFGRRVHPIVWQWIKLISASYAVCRVENYEALVLV